MSLKCPKCKNRFDLRKALVVLSSINMHCPVCKLKLAVNIENKFIRIPLGTFIRVKEI